MNRLLGTARHLVLFVGGMRKVIRPVDRKPPSPVVAVGAIEPLDRAPCVWQQVGARDNHTRAGHRHERDGRLGRATARELDALAIDSRPNLRRVTRFQRCHRMLERAPGRRSRSGRRVTAADGDVVIFRARDGWKRENQERE